MYNTTLPYITGGAHLGSQTNRGDSEIFILKHLPLKLKGGKNLNMTTG